MTQKHWIRRGLWCLPAAIVLTAVFAIPAGAGPAGADRTAIRKAAARIDGLAEKALKAGGLAPAPIADDATFLRRTYLTIIGRIPTAAEVRAFTRDGSTEKYSRLVNTLLDSPGRVSHEFNWWADMLRVRTRLQNRVSGEPYMHWIKQSIQENKPYDKMVHELMTAEGPVHQRDNGATGYMMRDRNMPEDNMSNTIRLFLGSRVECAQCHNHPFDKWTQKQYFQMVAFTGGIRYQQRPQAMQRFRDLRKKAVDKWGRNGQRALFRMLQPMTQAITGNGTAAVRLPKDYQYDDGKPNQWVSAEPIFHPQVHLTPNLPDPSKLPPRMRKNKKRMRRFMRRARPKEVDSRKAFADWLTSPANERFATVIANRLWKRAFGRGLIEPIDDIKDRTKAVAPELMAYLRQLMLDLDFDMKAFQRVLYHTRLWRRQAVSPQAVPGTLEDLRGPVLRRMSAEQAWDSLLTLVVADIDSRLRPPLNPRAERVYSEFDKLANATDEELMKRTATWVLRYSNPEEFRKQQRQQRNKQRAEQQRKRQQARPLYRDYARARKMGDRARMDEIEKRFEELGLPAPGRNAGGGLRDLQRASDLVSPARGGHILRELGQSQRDLIEAGHTSPTVPQVLAMLNSFIEKRLLMNNQAVLMRTLDKQRGGKATVKEAFLNILGRLPNAAERALWERDVARGGVKAKQDLVWTLVNTHEFLFIQ